MEESIQELAGWQLDSKPKRFDPGRLEYAHFPVTITERGEAIRAANKAEDDAAKPPVRRRWRKRNKTRTQRRRTLP